MLEDPNKILPAYLRWSTPDFKVVRDLLALGCDVNYKDEANKTPLYYSAKNESTPYVVFKLLIDAGANVNAASNYEDCCLTAYLGRQQVCTDVVQLILDSGFNTKFQLGSCMQEAFLQAIDS